MKRIFQMKRSGASAAVAFALVLTSAVLLCGAGSAPVENFTPQGAMQADLNAGGHNVTNVATLGAANVAVSGTLLLDGSPVTGTITLSNAAYLDANGNDGTGQVGNFARPFQTGNAAIAALIAAGKNTLVVGSGTFEIDNPSVPLDVHGLGPRNSILNINANGTWDGTPGDNATSGGTVTLYDDGTVSGTITASGGSVATDTGSNAGNGGMVTVYDWPGTIHADGGDGNSGSATSQAGGGNGGSITIYNSCGTNADAECGAGGSASGGGAGNGGTIVAYNSNGLSLAADSADPWGNHGAGAITLNNSLASAISLDTGDEGNAGSITYNNSPPASALTGSPAPSVAGNAILAGTDDSTTPSNTSTPVGWIHTTVNGTPSWIPYYQ